MSSTPASCYTRGKNPVPVHYWCITIDDKRPLSRVLPFLLNLPNCLCNVIAGCIGQDILRNFRSATGVKEFCNIRTWERRGEFEVKRFLGQIALPETDAIPPSSILGNSVILGIDNNIMNLICPSIMFRPPQHIATARTGAFLIHL